ncbi:MAG: EutN/CcmL family microcompartment protein [Lentihominibacter sp.]|nr:EutN/CcmL family microcompartment protein [Lentihominibacter sp.]
MKIGKVVGHLWSTKKQDSLTGMKLMIIEPMDPMEKCKEQLPIVAVDSVGAGIGEIVIYATGSSARKAIANSEAPVDAAVLGIVDNIEI